MEKLMNYLETLLETARIYFQHHPKYFYLGFALFCITASLFNWNWIFNPPYNSVKNPIGYYFGRTAMRITFFFLGILMAALCYFF